MATERIHQAQKTLTYGASLDKATAAVILLHGRGASAQSMLELATLFPSDGIAYLIPQAWNNTWYPNSGFAPFEVNEPYYSSAVDTIRGLIQQVNDASIPTDKIVLGGFSQGATLASDFVARHATRYGGVILFSGALMGPKDTARDYAGSLDNTPVYIGGANRDSWVTEAQLRETAEVLGKLGGQVTIEVQNSAEHTIRQSDIAHGIKIIEQLTQ